ncbi:acyltransferase [Massilibacteroides sp.]|uniref:acyltransferase n=1 Tax=Massilibacteroides sp. TaxID=2034766 RepID=UPI002606DA22|nr:acyltransferase [Massilibacteroides sp.]MDD4515974.1 acyltransferase [Massilibacteroides sp.]
MFESIKRILVRTLVCILPETRAFSFKRILYRMLGYKIAKNVRICSSVKIVGHGMLIVGENTWIGLDCTIIAGRGTAITIGKNVDIAPQVYIGTGTHEINTTGERMAGKGINKNITIKDGTWIGARSIILPGVTIGNMCIVAAGSVVNKSVESYKLVGGVPVRELKKL